MLVVNRHTDCDTDTPHYISIKRLHLYTLCMQCGLKIKRATSWVSSSLEKMAVWDSAYLSMCGLPLWVDIMAANLVGVLPGALDHPVPRSQHTSTAPSPASSCDADHNSSTRTVSHRHCMQSHDRITSGSELLWGWKGVDPPSSPLVGLAHHPWGWQKRSQ